jgi:hypothetical protein
LRHMAHEFLSGWLSHSVMQLLQKVCSQGSWTGESMGSVKQMEQASVAFCTGTRPVARKLAREERGMIAFCLR